MSDSSIYMQRALQLARYGLGLTAPNPAVGAVIVRDGEIIGEGFHPKAGEPHAEIFALQQAIGQTENADIYVTLEPCSHQGRTGPCVEALIAAKIKRVFVGTIDPNPLVAGRGIQRLKDAGIEVLVGFCEEECRELITPFAWHMKHAIPHCIYKAAMTFDGQMATQSGDSRWVSGEESRKRVHALRNQVDVIMVGVETIIADNPQLTTRGIPGGRDPLRVILDSHLRIPLSSHVLQSVFSVGTLIATTQQAPPAVVALLQNTGCEVLMLPESQGKVSLPELWRDLGRRGLQSILLEGGRTLASAALKAGLINRLQVYVAPKLLGGAGLSGLFAGEGSFFMKDALPLENVVVEKVGEDLLLTAEVISCLPD